MQKDPLQNPQLEIVKFLYQFKDDNKYYSLDESVLNSDQYEDSYIAIYNLRESALIATNTEVHNDPAKNIGEIKEIKAKILPKGILAVENFSDFN